jgi:hypothetical protein
MAHAQSSCRFGNTVDVVGDRSFLVRLPAPLLARWRGDAPA